jgi:hypothetical protein
MPGSFEAVRPLLEQLMTSLVSAVSEDMNFTSWQEDAVLLAYGLATGDEEGAALFPSFVPVDTKTIADLAVLLRETECWPKLDGEGFVPAAEFARIYRERRHEAKLADDERRRRIERLAQTPLPETAWNLLSAMAAPTDGRRMRTASIPYAIWAHLKAKEYVEGPPILGVITEAGRDALSARDRPEARP